MASQGKKDVALHTDPEETMSAQKKSSRPAQVKPLKPRKLSAKEAGQARGGVGRYHLENAWPAKRN